MRDARDTYLLCDVLTFVREDVATCKALALLNTYILGAASSPALAEDAPVVRATLFTPLDTPPPHLSRTAALRRVHDALRHRPPIPYGLRAQRWAMPAGIASVSCR